MSDFIILFIIVVLYIGVVSIILQLDSSLFIAQISTPSNPGDNTAVIAGVVAAVALAIAVVVFIIVFKR